MIQEMPESPEVLPGRKFYSSIGCMVGAIATNVLYEGPGSTLITAGLSVAAVGILLKGEIGLTPRTDNSESS